MLIGVPSLDSTRIICNFMDGNTHRRRGEFKFKVQHYKKGMIHLLDHAFFNFEGQRSLFWLTLFGLFFGGRGNR
jgi:hypothetical protein